MRKHYLSAVILILTIVCVAHLTKNKIRAKPNVVVIVIDTLGAAHLSFYGYEKDTAPFLGTLATKGIVFEHAYATSSWTAPSTASLFTSLYPVQHGVITGFAATGRLKETFPAISLNRIPEEAITLAEMFSQNGYRTYAVTDNINICKDEGFTQGFDKFINFPYESAQKVNETLLAWREEISQPSPYFLYIHYNDPHFPYHQRKPWFTDYQKKRLNRISAYDSEIRYTDEKIKQLFTAFGWDADTLVIITSDHGEGFGQHHKRWHGNTLYNELLHVPLIFYYPAGRFKNGTVTQRVSLIDILPTLRSIIAAPPDALNEGKSLLHLLQGRTASSSFASRPLYAHLWRKEEEFGKEVFKRAVIKNGYKYIISLTEENELFNLKKDHAEVVNRRLREPALARSLHDEILEFERTCFTFPQKSSRPTLDDALRKKLRSLGYMQ